MIKKLAMATVSLATLVAAQAAAAEAPAPQDAPAAEEQQDGAAGQDGSGNGEIVVTATRQATFVQDTPIAITAVTAETLETRGLTSTADLGNIVPNASFRQAQGAYGPAVTAFLRGVGQHDSALSGEPAVAFYIDDIYYPFLFGSSFDLLDLDHVEVLRGPQGTLFGRNALAGAVNMVSKRPSFDEASAKIEVTVGSYDRRDFRASFSVPLTENMAIGATMLSKKRTGYQRILDFTCEMYRRGTPQLAGSFPFASAATAWTSGSVDDCTMDHLGGQDQRAVRGQLYWEPAANLSVSIIGDYIDNKDDIAADYVYAIDRSKVTAAGLANLDTAYARWSVAGQPAFRYDERFITGDPFTTYATFRDPIPAGTVIAGNTYYNGSLFRGGLDHGRDSPLKTWGVSAKVVYGIADNIDLTLVGGYRKMDLSFSFDNDGSPVSETLIFHRIKEDHFTGEVRLSGKMDWLDWVAGFFYYDGHAFNGAQPMGMQNGTQRYQDTTYDPVSKAGYVNLNVHPLDGLSFTLGGRYSDDKKAVDFNNVLDGTPPGSTVFVPNEPQSTRFVTVPGETRFDWKLGVNYEFSDDVMVYASAATGYRLPGFNVRPSQPSQAGPTPGENLVSYEIGAKTDFFDRKVRVNFAAFYIDYKERVLSVAGQEARLDNAGAPVTGNSTVIPMAQDGATTCRAYSAGTDGARNPAAGIGVTCISRTFYLNSPGKVKGLEGEIDIRPVDGLVINGSFGYSQFSAPDLDALPATSNKRVLRVPDWTASAGIQYELPVPMLGGSITPRLDWYYQGSMVYSVTRKDTNQSGYSTFNGRITYHNEEHDFDLSLGATNLFNKFYYRNLFVYQDIGNAGLNGQPAPPREWYLSLSKKF
ncbi:TonB-dependent receptor [Sphingomonas canadensis]|uniref:TonB-dependent receptor n=1 Tax=Sphingomonas canadensis TaxID=1219257 RepID=A0ABW3H500_9SPHN|nr:TonB-dependent receptor [Sphingomonas canadensis]MCW3835611.1 TonB-dependent receptor [Sphingomonas canadensis]